MKRSNSLGAYVLSLPERTLRSLTALSAGLLREAGEIVLPAHFRRTRVYSSLVEQTLRFLIENVGQVEGAYAAGAPLPADFLVRRGAGNGLEMLSLAVFHASPVWVLAGLSDLSGAGGKVLAQIAGSLEREGLIRGGAPVRSMAQLLEALERGSGHLAETVNTPPLDIAALRAEWDRLKAAVERPPDPAVVESEWLQLTQTARKLDRSIIEVSTAVALSTLRSTVRSAQSMLTDPLLEHYRVTLAEMEQIGFPAYWSREMRPYLRAAAAGFSRSRRSSTEALLLRIKSESLNNKNSY